MPAVAILLAMPFVTVAAGAAVDSTVLLAPLPLPTLAPLPLAPLPLPTLAPLPLPTLAPLPLPTLAPLPLPTLAPLPLPTLATPPPTVPPPNIELEPTVTPLPSAEPTESQGPAPSISGSTPDASPTGGGDAVSPRSTPDASGGGDQGAGAGGPPGGAIPGGGLDQRGSPAADGNDNSGPLAPATLVAAGVVAAVATGLGLAHLLGISLGLGTLGGGFSAIATALDRRASRRVRAVLGALPGFGRWGVPALAPDAEDPILASMNLAPLADGARCAPRAPVSGMTFTRTGREAAQPGGRPRSARLGSD